MARLDFFEDFLHLDFGLFRDDPWTSRVVTKLSGVGDAVPHVVQTTLIQQVHNQLELVHALKVSHFRLIASFDKRFKTSLNQFANTAT